MKIAILSLIGLMAATDASSTVMPWWVEAGSTVILGALLAYLIIKRMPARDREHDAAMEKKDKLFAEMVREIADRQHDDSLELNKTMSELQITLAKK